MLTRPVICLILALACNKPGKAQQPVPVREKLYLHTDKNDYLAGDTIWYKLYLTEALYHTPSSKSGVAYVELIDESRRIIRRYALHTLAGTGLGEFATDTLFNPGKYIIRAYTRWMRNFGDSLLYEKEISLSRRQQQWFIANKEVRIEEGQNQSTVNLTFTLKDNHHQLLKDLTSQIFITDKTGRLIRKEGFNTGAGARVTVRFPISNLTDIIYAGIGDTPSQLLARFPVTLKKGPDLQFMPESGHLVAGIENTVAFKAVNENGKHSSLSGSVVDQSGQVITHFTPLYKGMGVFKLVPQPQGIYTALLANGQRIPLPAVEMNGTLVHVNNNHSSGNVEILIKGSGTALNKSYFLTVQQRGYEVYKTKIDLTATTPGIAIERSGFLSGVASVNLLAENGQVLNERAFFINHQDPLSLNFSTDKRAYHKRDSVSLKLTVRNAENLPVAGSFSIAVTDDGQVARNREQDPSILTYLLLQSDLKGPVETPGYYFSNTGDSIARAADALMLTQGFVRYQWDSTAFQYEAEPEFVIKGRIIKGINSGAKAVKVGLVGTQKDGSPLMLLAQTDDKGDFEFNNIPPFESSAFAAIVMGGDLKKLGKGVQFYYKADTAGTGSLAFTDDDGAKEPVIISNIALAEQEALSQLAADSTLLENVVVTAKKAIRNSENLNGPGGADQVITEAEIRTQYGKKKTLLDLLREKIKGFSFDGSIVYMTDPTGKKSPVRLKIYMDGIDFERASLSSTENMFPLSGTPEAKNLRDRAMLKATSGESAWVRDLNSFDMADIAGIEVMYSPKWSAAYKKRFLTYGEMTLAMQFVFIEITTYRGQGGYQKANIGKNYLFPQPFHYGRTFYAPRYGKAEGVNAAADFRSTVYWNGNVVTDEKGEAVLHFYTGDHPGTYTIWAEGMDLQGNAGMQAEKVPVQEE
ncbi:hypothetical protein [Niabella drilacis]|uniref:MG2 domain-containing protein n=1 Tax=Niabella drilacis (strain DSM 25811 / CCM 8410 / CCUG 62505 / LMG 26954 / E90) TaxID=1285928 RepID=A0A1G7BYN7_NIADE|nr:hypothetical protein [Niabella drilacis]SDE32208.1 hypothetical protein SAMN04487894_13511 [Niabella drilacis]